MNWGTKDFSNNLGLNLVGLAMTPRTRLGGLQFTATALPCAKLDGSALFTPICFNLYNIISQLSIISHENAATLRPNKKPVGTRLSLSHIAVNKSELT